MAYTKDDYIKDLYIAEHSSDASERGDAEYRAKLYERGRTNVIEKGYKEYADQIPISDYEIAVWGCLAVLNAADKLISDSGDRHAFITFLMERYNGFEDYDENERSLIRQIHNEAANAYHTEKAMYSGSQDTFLALKKDRDHFEEKLVPLMKKYKEDYYDKHASGRNTDGDSGGGGCAVALIVVVLLIIVLVRGCVG